MSKLKFLSSRISDIHSQPRRPPSQRLQEDEDEEARTLFERIKKEAESLGISALEEKERKKVEFKTLELLGAKPRKGQKMPISMGLGIVRKREERQQQQRQIAIAEGIAPQSKKRKRENAPRDRGLMASEGVFKNGTLYVKPAQKAVVEEKVEPKKKRFRKGKNGSAKKKKMRRKGGKRSR